MLKTNLQVTPKVFALPLEIAYDKTPSYFVFAVRFLCFLFQVVRVAVPKKVLYEVPPTLAAAEPETFKATKAPRRRKRKPSKAMRNLYQLQ